MEAQPSQNKVDMSLDEIIKLSKKEKQRSIKQARGRGRGTARGYGRGRGGQFSGRGRGKVQNVGTQNIRGKQTMRGVNTNTARGRGGIVRGRGRGRGTQIQNIVSPLNRTSTETFKTVKRGRGRGQRGRGNSQTPSRTFTNSNQAKTNTPQAQRRQRLNVVKAQAALLRKKEMAVKKLQTARKTMQDINKALQKTARGNLVDSKRGFLPANGSPPPGQGNRKLLTGLMRQDFKGSNMSLASNTSGRQMVNTSVTITNQTAARKRRQWRPKNSDVTIQVANEVAPNTKPEVQKQSSIIDQLKMLKPAIPTTYKFQKNVFAASSTTLSLNDRFSSSSSSSSSSLLDNGNGEGRKVFI